MTFFRSIATDLRDDTPIFVVGFIPSPARDVIQAASLYRGRSDLVRSSGLAARGSDSRCAESLGAEAVHRRRGHRQRAAARARDLHASQSLLRQARGPGDRTLHASTTSNAGVGSGGGVSARSRRRRETSARTWRLSWPVGRAIWRRRRPWSRFRPCPRKSPACRSTGLPPGPFRGARDGRASPSTAIWTSTSSRASHANATTRRCRSPITSGRRRSASRRRDHGTAVARLPRGGGASREQARLGRVPDRMPIMWRASGCGSSASHPERLEELIGEIAMGRSLLER